MKSSGYNGQVIMTIWSFKPKRNLFGEITKCKARLCAHGGQTQKEVHYDDIYMIQQLVGLQAGYYYLCWHMCNVYGWKSRQIDFVLAFPQANVKTYMFMQVPLEVNSQNGLQHNESVKNPRYHLHVLKLLKNVGLKDGPLTWYEHLTKGLLKRGFTQSNIDPCLFIKKNIVFVREC
jgi:hypothetical protein